MSNNSNIVMIYITFSSFDDAKRIAQILIKERLMACANLIDKVTSVYFWKGKMEGAKEVIMIGKTVKDKVDEVISRVKELHSYDLPCIVAIPVLKGNPEFLQWVHEETRGDHRVEK